MKEWQFTVLFCVAVGGAVFLLVAPAIPGFEGVPKNPSAVGGVGTMLAYVLSQKKAIVKKPDKSKKTDEEGEEE